MNHYHIYLVEAPGKWTAFEHCYNEEEAKATIKRFREAWPNNEFQFRRVNHPQCSFKELLHV